MLTVIFSLCVVGNLSSVSHLRPHPSYVLKDTGQGAWLFKSLSKEADKNLWFLGKNANIRQQLFYHSSSVTNCITETAKDFKITETFLPETFQRDNSHYLHKTDIYRVGQKKLEHSFLDCNVYNFYTDVICTWNHMVNWGVWYKFQINRSKRLKIVPF